MDIVTSPCRPVGRAPGRRGAYHALLSRLEYDPGSPQGGGARSRSGPDRPALTRNGVSCLFSKEVSMPHFLSEDERQRTPPAETAAFASPVPTQIVSNGEYNPLPQSREQARVEGPIQDPASAHPPRQRMG